MKSVPSSIRALAHWAFGVAALGLLMLTAVGYRTVVRAQTANLWVAHTSQVLSALDGLLTTMADAEADVLNDRATRQNRDRQRSDLTRSALAREVDSIATLTADNPAQQRRVAALRAQITTTIGLLQSMVSVSPNQMVGREVRTQEQTSMAGIRATLRSMRSEELRLMDERYATAGRAATRTGVAIFVMAIAAFSVLVLSFVLVDRRATQLRHAHDLLEVALGNERQACQAKDAFLMTVSHELRTPLTAIYGWSRLLMTGRLRKDREPHALEAIHRSAEVQNRLINDLLDSSRAITGKLQIHVGAANLTNIVRSAATNVEPAAEAKSVRLELALDHDVVIAGDADRLQQVAWNLLSNAIKFTPIGGRVSVRLERSAWAVDLVVSDNGEGIPADFLPFVFDRFRQADASPTRSHGGLGLGLAIVRSLVELHGGTVQAHSGGRGCGATFRVRLPLPQPNQNTVMSPMDKVIAVPANRIDGVRVLVVDDEENTRDVLASILDNAGADVRTAHSVPAALQIINKWEPAVLLSDIVMPGPEDGYSLIRTVRTLRGRLIRAAAVTAYAGRNDRDRALREGYDALIAKPVEPTRLVGVVTSLMAAETPSRNMDTL